MVVLLCNAFIHALFFGFLDVSLASDPASHLDFISTNLIQNSSQLTTFQFVSKTNVGNHNETELITAQKSNGTNHLQRRKKPNGRKKISRRRRIGKANSTIPSLGPRLRQNRLNSTRVRNQNSRRRKFRNRRKKQKLTGTILDITTAKAIVISRRDQSNATINKLIEKLNKNPEDNFDEFKSKKRTDKKVLISEKAAISERGQPLENFTEIISINNNTVNFNSRVFSRCRRNRGGCAHFCNPKGKTRCSCMKGFFLETDQRSCHDIDECTNNNGQCESECVNLMGSYYCRCPDGFALTDDKFSCQDVNECLLRNGHGPCQDTCKNTLGSYECSCVALNGTKLGSDRHTCEDLDECLVNNGGCSHTCINTLGRSFCGCPNGMELSSDWKTCQDINECETEAISATCNNCLNTEGSYICPGISDIQSDQSSVGIVCKPLFPPIRGFISCTRKGALQPITRKGRKRTINSPGTLCKLVCPTGYRIVGEYSIICGVYGEWEGNRVGKCIPAAAPELQCPPSQYLTLPKGSRKVPVKFSSPITNVHWKYVKSSPRWAKGLDGYLTEGQHEITFTVKDPTTRLFSSCSFKIFVVSHSF